eukprot:4260129-Lingulodinium_polyedra.AAC.1
MKDPKSSGYECEGDVEKGDFKVWVSMPKQRFRGHVHEIAWAVEQASKGIKNANDEKMNGLINMILSRSGEISFADCFITGRGKALTELKKKAEEGASSSSGRAASSRGDNPDT